MIKDTIKSLRETIGQSNTGHLPLSCRVGLMKQIGNVLTHQIVNDTYKEIDGIRKKSREQVGMQ